MHSVKLGSPDLNDAHSVTIAISGAQGSGKSTIAECVADLLLAMGIPVAYDPDHGPITPNSKRQLPLTGVTVNIVEVESTDAAVRRGPGMPPPGRA